jgi:hypothetical protein
MSRGSPTPDRAIRAPNYPPYNSLTLTRKIASPFLWGPRARRAQSGATPEAL